MKSGTSGDTDARDISNMTVAFAKCQALPNILVVTSFRTASGGAVSVDFKH